MNYGRVYNWLAALNRNPTLEVKCNVCVTFTVRIESIATVIAAIIDFRIGNLQCEHVRVASGSLARHFDARRIFACFFTLIPCNVWHRIRFQTAFHYQYVTILSDCRFFWETWRFTIWNSTYAGAHTRKSGHKANA